MATMSTRDQRTRGYFSLSLQRHGHSRTGLVGTLRFAEQIHGVQGFIACNRLTELDVAHRRLLPEWLIKVVERLTDAPEGHDPIASGFEIGQHVVKFTANTHEGDVLELLISMGLTYGDRVPRHKSRAGLWFVRMLRANRRSRKVLPAGSTRRRTA